MNPFIKEIEYVLQRVLQICEFKLSGFFTLNFCLCEFHANTMVSLDMRIRGTYLNAFNSFMQVYSQELKCANIEDLLYIQQKRMYCFLHSNKICYMTQKMTLLATTLLLCQLYAIESTQIYICRYENYTIALQKTLGKKVMQYKFKKY